MRRTLAWICIALVTIAFILLSLVLILKIDVIIPILLFVVAFIMFLMIKRMPTDEQRKQDMETHERRDIEMPFEKAQTVFIPNGVAHIVVNNSDKDFILLAYTDKLYDPADTIKFDF